MFSGNFHPDVKLTLCLGAHL